MKAILVIDEIPQNCQKCFACINIQNFTAMCVACGEKLKISELDIRPSYCPLKPLPQYQCEDRVYGYGAEYENGFDDCLNEILGGEE